MTATASPSTLRTALLAGGSILVVALLVAVVVAVLTAANRPDASRVVTIDTAFDTLSVTAEVADVRIEFGGVDETVVEFEQRGANRDLSFEAEASGGTLAVAVAEHGAAPWFFGDFSESPRLTVTLPAALDEDALAVDLETDAGDIVLDGDFGEVSLISTVGDVRLDGSAERLDVETTVGEVTLDGYGITGTAALRTTSGDVDASLESVPAGVDISTNVGDVDLELPTGDYRIDTSTNVGDVTINAPSDPDAETIVHVDTTVGDITVDD